MAETRLIQKQLAGVEDLLLGIGTATQTRATGPKTITKINADQLQGALVVDTIDELLALNPTLLVKGTCIVKDENRGGVFAYLEANALVNNGGTIFNGWTRQYDGAVNVKWFTNIESAFLFTDIFFPSGTYNITSTINLLSGTKVKGAGANTILIIADGITAFKASIDGTRVDGYLMLKDIIFEDILFQGSNALGTIGIALNNVTTSSFKNILFNGLDKVIVQDIVTSTTFDNISNSNLENSTTDCNYVVYSTTAGRSNDNIYTKCIARAKYGCLYLGGTTGGQHDGANIVNNIFFPNSSDGLDLVYLYNAVWSTVAGNKFFVSARNGIRAEYAFTTSTISDNLFAWNGRYTSGGGDAIYISTSAGSSVTTYGQSIISNNVISMPSGNGIYINSLGSFKINGNNIVSPNNTTTDDTGTVVAYTKDGISINGVSTYFDVSNNTVTTGRHGDGAESFATNWRYDVYVSDTSEVGKLTHSSYSVRTKETIKNNFSMLDGYSRASKVKASVKNIKSPYSTTGFTQLTAITAIITAESVPNPYQSGLDTVLQIVFPASVVSGVQRGEIATTAGGKLSVCFKARTTDKDIVRCLVAIKENGGTKRSKNIDVTSTWNDYFLTIDSTISAGYSILEFQNNANSAGGTVQIAELRVMATDKIVEPFSPYKGTAIPVSGYYNSGDIIENEVPVASGFLGWVCTTAGIPGTWKTFGAITA